MVLRLRLKLTKILYFYYTPSTIICCSEKMQPLNTIILVALRQLLPFPITLKHGSDDKFYHFSTKSISFCLVFSIRCCLRVKKAASPWIVPVTYQTIDNVFNLWIRLGGLAIAVPGELKGYSTLYELYGGGVSWPSLFKPTIELCEEGIQISSRLGINLINNEQLIKNDVLLRYNGDFFALCYLLRVARYDPRRFCFKPTLRSLFLCNFYVSEKTSMYKRVNCFFFFFCRKTFYNEKIGHVKKAGEKYTLPKLAETMKIIAKEGADAVYRGSLTSELLKDLKKINSIITAEDLSNYKLVAH